MSAQAARRGAVVVGAGLMGRWHAHAIAAAGQRVIAVVDRDADRARALAARHGARAMDLRAALDLAPLAVHVCTATDSHQELAGAAIAAGAHVLIEKPFAPSATVAAQILDRAAASSLIACPVHQFLFQRGVRRTLARLPAFGPLLHADFVACSAGADETSGAVSSPERRVRLALDILPHPLSLLRRALGAPLAGVAWAVMSPAPGEVRVSGTDGRVSIGILLSAAGRPTRNTARFVGEHGTMHLDLFHGFATFEPPAVSRWRKIARPFTVAATSLAGAATNLARRALAREPAYPGLRELTGGFYAAIERGAAPPIMPAETLDVSAVADRLAELLHREPMPPDARARDAARLPA